MGCDHLVHHGIKGQKWGVRRYQNADGTLTSAGKKHQERREKQQYKKEYKTDKLRKKRLEGVAFEAGKYSQLYDKRYDKLSRRTDKAVSRQMEKKGVLSEKVEERVRTTEQLRRDKEYNQKYSDEALKRAEKFTRDMVKKYPDKKIKDVKTYEKKGREYVKSFTGMNTYSLKKVIVFNNNGDRLSQYEMRRTEYSIDVRSRTIDVKNDAAVRYRGK